MLLEKHGFEVMTASSGTAALEIMERQAFELYVFDLKLPGMDGYELTEATLRRQPEAIIVILTGEDIAEHYDRLMESGVTGVLEKAAGEAELIQTLRLALQHFTILPTELARQLRTKNHFLLQHPQGAGANRPLSDREVSVLKLIALGHKNKDIADRLFMSQRNVEYSISHLFEKLGVSSRQDAVLKGIEGKWLNLEA